MTEAFICDAVRSPIGKLNGILSTARHPQRRRRPDDR
jgi:hypothetical protein